jgi:hypothetical protein
VIGAALRLSSTAATIAGAVLCFGLRFIAIRRGWHLPVAGEPELPTPKARAPKDRKDDGAGSKHSASGPTQAAARVASSGCQYQGRSSAMRRAR